MPPHLSSQPINGSIGDVRYTKEQMVAIYKQQRDSGQLDAKLSSLFTASWNPREAKEPSTPAWGRKEDKEPAAGPEVCWNHNAVSEPLALSAMDEQEREVGRRLLVNGPS